MATFTVIGVHEGGAENRFAGTYEAADPTEAEEMALSDHPALLVAGVAEGDVRTVDDDPACQVGTRPRP